MWLSLAALAEAEELEDDALGPSEQRLHAVLQLLIAPLEGAVQRPRVADGRHVQEHVLGQPPEEAFELIFLVVVVVGVDMGGIRGR